jgi:hypothetical protein
MRVKAAGGMAPRDVGVQLVADSRAQGLDMREDVSE